MMKRTVIQAEPELLLQARKRAQALNISFAQLVRNALRREVGLDGNRQEFSFIGSTDQAGQLTNQARELKRVPPRNLHSDPA